MRSLVTIAALAASLVALSACAPATGSEHDGRETSVVVTTPILTDLTRQVAGERAAVTGLMPPTADPHTFEPGLRAVRDIANADLALTHGLLLEQQALITTVTNSSPAGTPVTAVAEKASTYGATLIPLVENVALDAVWLGLRAAPAEGSEPVPLSLREVRGPGDVAAFITSTFGTPEVLFNSADGLDDKDTVLLPPGAHTHVSWAFSSPGVYELDIASGELPAATVTVAVGVDAAASISMVNPVVIDAGHVDIAAGETNLIGDAPDGADRAHRYPLESTVIAVPSSTLQPIPGDPGYRFLGRPGQETYLLPQAVLGRHVHGEIDPHLWHDVANVQAMVEVIRDELSAVDPAGAAVYHANAAAYLARLDELDATIKTTLSTIPARHRHLITTHHGYSYLGRAYGMSIAGFVTPNPSVEPSPRDLIALTRTLENLEVPAVFLEPELARGATVLGETADRLGVRVCPIYGDTFDTTVTTYLDLMAANARSLADCLTPGKTS